MTSKSIAHISDMIKIRPIPSELRLLQEAAELEWVGRSDDEVDAYCDLLLRINANIIVCTHEMVGDSEEDYMRVFDTILKKLRYSNLIALEEFSVYYEKFKEYMSDS